MSFIDSLLSQFADKLGPLSPIAKAVVPAAVALVVAVVQSVAQHNVDATTITEAVSGLVLAVITYFVPNRPKATATAVPPDHISPLPNHPVV